MNLHRNITSHPPKRSPPSAIADLLVRHGVAAERARCFLRLGIVLTLLAAVIDNTNPLAWDSQYAVIALYGFTALLQLLAWMRWSPKNQRQAALASWLGDLIDIAFVFTLQLFSDGELLPFAVMTILPFLCALQVNRKISALSLFLIMCATVVALVEDPVLGEDLNWREMFVVLLLQAILCTTSYLLTLRQEYRLRDIADQFRTQEILLFDVMSAEDSERSALSEAVHDGPLQSALALSQDLRELLSDFHKTRMVTALYAADEIARSLRRITSDLHPLVLEHTCLIDLTRSTAEQVCSKIGAELNFESSAVAPIPFDRVTFGAVREVLANIGRHSHAKTVGIAVKPIAGGLQFDINDDGIGFTSEDLRTKLAAGHIGVASHKARVEVAGGTFDYLRTSKGAHVRIWMPSNPQVRLSHI